MCVCVHMCVCVGGGGRKLECVFWRVEGFTFDSPESVPTLAAGEAGGCFGEVHLASELPAGLATPLSGNSVCHHTICGLWPSAYTDTGQWDSCR